MARKPSALARELVRNFPKGKRRGKKQRGESTRRRKAAQVAAEAPELESEEMPDLEEVEDSEEEAA
jgi:hypothetical protein